MGGWTQLSDASWHRIESVFGLQAPSQRTPPIRPIITDPPPAPRKVRLGCRNQQIRRENLKPRKLTYESESQCRVDTWDHDSGIAVWATTSSSLLAEDVDKENRPENGKRQPAKCRSKGKARTRGNLPAKSVEYRPLRI